MEEQKQELMEINIDSPKHIRQAHLDARYKWMNEQKEQHNRELKRRDYQINKITKRRLGICMERNCIEPRCKNTDNTLSVHCIKHKEMRIPKQSKRGLIKVKNANNLCIKKGCYTQAKIEGLCDKHNKKNE